MIQLVSAKLKEPIETTIAMLRSRSLIDMHDAQQSYYMTQYNIQKVVKSLILEKAELVKKGVPGSVLAIMDKLRARFNERTFASLAPHAIVLSRHDFPDDFPFPKFAKPILSWWGNYTAIAIAAWCNSDVQGLWLITNKGANYLPLQDEQTVGNGFGKVASVAHDRCFIVDDIGHALRLTLWSIVQNNKPYPFIVPFGAKDNCETYKAKEVIFWSPSDDIQWLARSVLTPAAKSFKSSFISNYNKEVDFPCKGNFKAFQDLVNQEASISYGTLARHILSLPADKAKSDLALIKLEPADKAKILSYVSGDDSKVLSNLLNDNSAAQTIAWNGATITETPDGWVCKGRVISSVMFYIDEVHPIKETGDATLVGTVIHNKKSYPFRELLSNIKRNPGQWLERFIIAKSGLIPFVDKPWTHKLLEVSQQFKIPTPVLVSKQYGWNDKVLRMPMFSVDRNGIYPAHDNMDGPKIAYPAPLSTREYEAFRKDGFGRAALAFLGNLLRLKANKTPYGLLLTNEPHVIGRLANCFGTNILTSINTDLLELYKYAPLPAFLALPDDKVKEALQGAPHICTSVDTITAELAYLHGNWLHLRITDNIDFDALRAIFLLLPSLLKTTLDVQSRTFFRDLAKAVQAADTNIAATGLNSAALDLDLELAKHGNSMATRIMELVSRLDKAGLVHIGESDLGITIPKQAVQAAVAGAALNLPPLGTVEDSLVSAGFLTAKDGEIWTVSRQVWGFYGATAGV
jgi:hypothetical protein